MKATVRSPVKENNDNVGAPARGSWTGHERRRNWASQRGAPAATWDAFAAELCPTANRRFLGVAVATESESNCQYRISSSVFPPFTVAAPPKHISRDTVVVEEPSERVFVKDATCALGSFYFIIPVSFVLRTCRLPTTPWPDVPTSLTYPSLAGVLPTRRLSILV